MILNSSSIGTLRHSLFPILSGHRRLQRNILFGQTRRLLSTPRLLRTRPRPANRRVSGSNLASQGRRWISSAKQPSSYLSSHFPVRKQPLLPYFIAYRDLAASQCFQTRTVRHRTSVSKAVLQLHTIVASPRNASISKLVLPPRASILTSPLIFGKTNPRPTGKNY